MVKAEGRIFDWYDESHIKPSYLEAVEFTEEFSEIVEIRSEEFSAVCPFSGLPDIAKLLIKYEPDKHIIELKSLKYYLTSFRSVGVYQEKANSIIYRDFWECVKPKSLTVELLYNTRGGMDVRSVICSSRQVKQDSAE